MTLAMTAPLRALTERPILFSGPMVREVLADRKGQTRRMVKPQPKWGPSGGGFYPPERTANALHYASAAHVALGFAKDWCPYGAPGDRLWVRETVANVALPSYPPVYVFRADGDTADGAPLPPGVKWKPSIFCPRDASRLTLEITQVRVERVQDISPEDIAAEGVTASAVRDLLGPLAARAERALWACHWLTGETKGGDNPAGPNYCKPCATKAARSISKAGGEVVVDGGWSTDHDSNPYCETCGRRLEGALTGYGAGDELAHYEAHDFDASPDEALDLVRAIDALTGQELASYAELWWRIGWSLINGRASWDANPFVWAISFRRAQDAARASGGAR